MTHGGPIHNDLGKSSLALHCTEDHDLDGRVQSVIWPPLAQLRRLRLEELLRMHRDLHQPAPRDAAWPTTPVSGVSEGLAASRAAGVRVRGSGSTAPVESPRLGGGAYRKRDHRPA